MTPSYIFIYQRRGTKTLEIFIDVDWVGNTDHRRSIASYTFKIGGGLVIWYCKAQSLVSLSSIVSEYKALMEGTREATQITTLLRDLRFIGTQPIKMFCDNIGSAKLDKNHVFIVLDIRVTLLFVKKN